MRQGTNDSMPLTGKIEIKGSDLHSRKRGRPILKGIDLTIPEGERLVLAGRTGSGKTTLCHLLVRILESPEGSIFFNGLEIHRIPLKSSEGIDRLCSPGYLPLFGHDPGEYCLWKAGCHGTGNREGRPHCPDMGGYHGIS